MYVSTDSTLEFTGVTFFNSLAGRSAGMILMRQVSASGGSCAHGSHLNAMNINFSLHQAWGGGAIGDHVHARMCDAAIHQWKRVRTKKVGGGGTCAPRTRWGERKHTLEYS